MLVYAVSCSIHSLYTISELIGKQNGIDSPNESIRTWLTADVNHYLQEHISDKKKLRERAHKERDSGYCSQEQFDPTASYLDGLKSLFNGLNWCFNFIVFPIYDVGLWCVTSYETNVLPSIFKIFEAEHFYSLTPRRNLQFHLITLLRKGPFDDSLGGCLNINHSLRGVHG